MKLDGYDEMKKRNVLLTLVSLNIPVFTKPCFCCYYILLQGQSDLVVGKVLFGVQCTSLQSLTHFLL